MENTGSLGLTFENESKEKGGTKHPQVKNLTLRVTLDKSRDGDLYTGVSEVEFFARAYGIDISNGTPSNFVSILRRRWTQDILARLAKPTPAKKKGAK